jgi:hypothetical protein
MDAGQAQPDIVRLKRMTPIYQANSQYLADLVVRQYFGLEICWNRRL